MNIEDGTRGARRGAALSAGRGSKPTRGARCRALCGAIWRTLEALEPRVLLSAVLYVNNDWQTVGEFVDNSGAGDDGSLHDLTLGTNAFETLAGALTAATAGDRIVVVSGDYAESVEVTKGVSLEGWGYFAAASSLPAANPDALHVNQSALNATLVTQINGAQLEVNDAAGADTVTVRGMAFSGMGATASIWSPATNQAGLTVRDNSFTDIGTTGTAVRIDAGSAALPIDIRNNVFTGVSKAVEANGVTGTISSNSMSAMVAIAVSGGENLTIAQNTIGVEKVSDEFPGIGIAVDSSGPGVVVSGNLLTLADVCDGIVVANTGTETVEVTGNELEGTGWFTNVGIIVTNEGAGLGLSDGRTRATVSANMISGLVCGISWDGMGTDPTGGLIAGNSITDIAYGIFLQHAAQLTVSGNDLVRGEVGILAAADSSVMIAGNSVSYFGQGIRFDSGAPGTITGTHFDTGTANATDIQIVTGGQLVLAGGDHFGNAGAFVNNSSPTRFTLVGEDFGSVADLKAKLIGVTAVVGESVFYKGSSFDVGGHDHAIAADKTALLGGQTASFANYTSYDRGLNGLMMDIVSSASALTAGDFAFKTGNDGSPDGWTPVTAVAAITMRPEAGKGGTTRVEITFDDENAPRNTWLQVTLLGASSGLARDVVFYFGNTVGEAGNSATDARVDAIDQLVVRGGATEAADITNPLDFNRDGVVNLNQTVNLDQTDETIARQNVSWFGNELHLITVPETPIAPAAVVAAASESTTSGGPAADFSTVAPTADAAADEGATREDPAESVATAAPTTVAAPAVERATSEAPAASAATAAPVESATVVPVESAASSAATGNSGETYVATTDIVTTSEPGTIDAAEDGGTVLVQVNGATDSAAAPPAVLTEQAQSSPQPAAGTSDPGIAVDAGSTGPADPLAIITL